jgi:hypothetical protein
MKIGDNICCCPDDDATCQQQQAKQDMYSVQLQYKNMVLNV